MNRVERGCVESDELSHSNGTEILSQEDRAMGRRNAEGMCELVPTGLKPRWQSPACLQHARIMWASGPGVGNPGCDPACFQHAGSWEAFAANGTHGGGVELHA